MTAIILAGGKSSRMGRDKAFLKIEGVPMIRRQLKLLRKFFKKITIVTNSPHKYKFRNVKIIKDIVPGQGPLGGIYSGLMASKSFHNFVLACDMPFIDLSLVRYMCKKARGYDVIIPKIDNRYETLFCIYSQNCKKHIRELLDKKIFKIRRFFQKVKVRKITKREVSRFVSCEKIFVNLNTPKDLYRLK